MKVAIVGYGKMGHEIEGILIERGHQICGTYNEENKSELNLSNLQKADIAIEFSQPDAAVSNYQLCFEVGIPVVSGTTGWLDKLNEVKKLMKQQNGTLFYAPNFSLGVNLFFKMNEMIARMMNKFPAYKVEMEEVHHTAKLDSPSGTAIRTAEVILKEVDAKDSWSENVISSENQLLIGVKREENVPGTHKVTYLSEVDKIDITHTAFSRKGFALGAVLAAEWILEGEVPRKGFLEMSDMLEF